MNAINDLKIAVKLIGSFILVAAIIVVVAVISFFKMEEINDGMTTLYFDSTLPIEQIGNADAALWGIRGDLYKYVLLADERDATAKTIASKIEILEENMGAFHGTNMVAEEVEVLAEFDEAWAVYLLACEHVLADVDAGNESTAIASIVDGGETANARKAVGGAMDRMVEINTHHAEEIHAQGDLTHASTVQMLLIAGIIGVVLALVLGVGISRSIVIPMALLVDAAKALATGDTLRDMDEAAKDKVRLRGDEVGDVGKAVDALTNYMQEMGEIAMLIAENDLTPSVTPKSEKDELGHAFMQMIDSLRGSMLEVANNAANLAAASEQLASAAKQSGLATNQIASTTQQIASGIRSNRRVLSGRQPLLNR